MEQKNHKIPINQQIQNPASFRKTDVKNIMNHGKREWEDRHRPPNPIWL